MRSRGPRHPSLLLALAALLGRAGRGDADGLPDCPSVFQDLSGVATYYSATGAGACGFDPSSDLMVTAVAAPDWAGSAHCGRCLRVWGPEATIVVRVVDLCPECPTGHLDLSAEAFDIIANPVQGVVPIAFRSIPCPVSGNLLVKQKEGSNAWWLALQPRNSRHEVAGVELRETGSTSWTSLARQDYNYFVATSGSGNGFDFPIDLRLTDVHGRLVAADNLLAGVAAGSVTPFPGQFAACAGVFVDDFETGTATPLWTSHAP
jgi:expansin (peptidoglycan-binding protein)